MLQSESEGEVCVSGGFSPSLCSTHRTAPTQRPVAEGRIHRSGTVSSPNSNNPVLETMSLESEMLQSESEGEVCVSGGFSTSLCSSHQTAPTQHPVGEG